MLTSWDEVPDEWWGVFAVWKGGLGVWGGIALGTIVGRDRRAPRGRERVRRSWTRSPRGLLVAQAIGRWGNWWNQELFGEPTDRPWGLEIDPENRPAEFVADATFHPTFLYEFVWNLVGSGVLLLVERTWRIRPPGLFALYVALYSFGPLLRGAAPDRPGAPLGPSRLNAWVSVVLFVLAVAFFVWWQVIRARRRRRRGRRRRRRWRSRSGRVRRAR